MKVSVIIPAYNAEKHIIHSLDSLNEQTIKDFEIVIIDDGSEDRTAEVVEDYKRKNSHLNLSMYKKCNGGVASARNYGKKKAKGDYLMFLDADDKYRNDCIEVMLNTIEKTNTDMVIAGYTRNPNCFNRFEKNEIRICSPKEAMSIWMYNNPPRVFCSIIYKRDIVLRNSIEFPKGTKYGEDLEFTWNYLSRVNCVAIMDDQVYAYIENDNSAVHNVNWSKTDLINSTIRICEMLHNYDHDFGTKYENYMLPRTIWAVARTFCKYDEYDLLVELERKYSTKNALKQLIIEITSNSKDYNGDYLKKSVIVLSSIAYNIHPRLFFVIVNLN